MATHTVVPSHLLSCVECHRGTHDMRDHSPLNCPVLAEQTAQDVSSWEASFTEAIESEQESFLIQDITSEELEMFQESMGVSLFD